MEMDGEGEYIDQYGEGEYVEGGYPEGEYPEGEYAEGEYQYPEGEYVQGGKIGLEGFCFIFEHLFGRCF